MPTNVEDEAARLFTSPEDSFAVLVMASTAYIHDTERSIDPHQLEDYSIKVVDAFRDIAHGHPRGEVAFALLGLITAVVSGYRRPGPLGTVLDAEMIAAARVRLTMELVEKMAQESVEEIEKRHRE